VIGQTISHYRILEALGKGGMGTVYLAEDMLLGRFVAVKFLTADPGKQHYRARFLREARSISAISHPNIANIYDYGETPDSIPFIVMELVKGQTLSDLLQTGTLTLARVLEIVEAVARALAAAHQNNIIHRDIKPTNLAINERGEVKVLDFGLAKNLDDGAGSSVESMDTQAFLATQTREGVVIGTPMYLSPEQALGGSVDARSDLFSLGSVLYECLTGQPAFPGRSAADICAKVIRDDPPPPSHLNPDVPPQLNRLTLKALAKKAEDRYQTADEFLTDLGRVRESLWDVEAVCVPRAPVKTSGLRTSRLTVLSNRMRHPRLLGIAFLTSLILALLTVWVVMTWRHRAAPGQPLPEAVQWYREGTNALREGTYYKARKALEKAISIDNNFSLAHARLAEVLTELEYTDRAKDELLRGARTSLSPALSPSESLYLQAINLSLTGDPKGAIETYLKIVEQAQDEERAPAYVDLGRAYERDGDVKKAIESFHAAIKLDPQYTAAAMRLGALYGRRLGQENTETALSHFKIAETRYEILNDVEGMAEVFYQRGVMYMTQRKLDVAREQLSQTLLKAEAIDNKYQQIKARMQLSSVLCLEGDTASAERYASEVLDFAKANSLENLMANALLTLGNAFLGRSDLVQAQKYFDRALEVAQIYKARRSEARASLTLASLASQHHSQPAKVREYVERAVALYQQEGSRKYTMQAQALLGHASDQQDDYAAALKAFEQQLQLALQLDDQEQATLAYIGLGIALAHQEEYSRALENFNQSYEISKPTGLAPNITYALFNRGKVLWQVGLYEEAQKALAEASLLNAKASKPNTELIARLNLVNAQLALSQRRFDEAKAAGRKALDLSQGEFEAISVEATYTVGLAQALSGDSSAGLQLCNKGLEAARQLDSVRLVSAALLAVATARMEAGDSQGALEAALEAREKFRSAGQQDSEWRSLLVAALARKRAGEQNEAQRYAALSAELLGGLQSRLGDSYRLYLERLDIQFARQQLKREFDISL
jgi:tetratricopeptide (TPR) repeat protein/predicted Ser/Thr protein kinase